MHLVVYIVLWLYMRFSPGLACYSFEWRCRFMSQFNDGFSPLSHVHYRIVSPIDDGRLNVERGFELFLMGTHVVPCLLSSAILWNYDEKLKHTKMCLYTYDGKLQVSTKNFKWVIEPWKAVTVPLPQVTFAQLLLHRMLFALFIRTCRNITI